jgi:nitric oxide dioxygenase
MSLTAIQKGIIKASIPFLEQHGVELTSTFYQHMFKTHPEVKDYFNLAHQGPNGAQPRILAYSLLQYAKNIDDLTPLTAFVKGIVEKHVGLQVFPAQYDIVGSCLLQTLEKMVGEGATPEFLGAWKDAYYQLANLLIQMEKERYAEVEQSLNGWTGWKQAKITKIVQESESVKSFHLQFPDGKYVKPQPGQYVTVKLDVDGDIETREYSVSSELADNYNEYRISVKRIPNGKASNFIHDNLKEGDELPITVPYGILKPVEVADNAPITFFIGGIGVTPTVSLIESYLAKGHQVRLLYSNRNDTERVFEPLFQRLLSNENFSLHEFVSESNLPASTHPRHNIEHKRVTHDDLKKVELHPEAHFFVLGPIGYMEVVTGFLTMSKVPSDRVHCEQFGPTHV